MGISNSRNNAAQAAANARVASKDSMSIVEQFKVAREAEGFSSADKTVGGNGLLLGESVTLTGNIIIAKVEGSASYMAMETEEGLNISLLKFMGVPSLNQYALEGNFEHEYDNDKGEMVTTTYTAQVIDADFTPYWCGIRSMFAFAEYVEAHKDEFAGRKLTYVGDGVQQYTAKSDAPDTSIEKYKAGYKRCRVQHIYALD